MSSCYGQGEGSLWWGVLLFLQAVLQETHQLGGQQDLFQEQPLPCQDMQGVQVQEVFRGGDEAGLGHGT